MNKKHLDIRKQQLKLLASASPCIRRKVSALIVAPGSNVVISEGYNGTPRQSISILCGGITKVYAPLNYAEHRAGLEYLQDNQVVLEKL